MKVRFSNLYGCKNCTQTVDFNHLRAIGMLNSAQDVYYVRVSFDNGDTLCVKNNMTLAEAIAYRNKLESYWLTTYSAVAKDETVHEVH